MPDPMDVPMWRHTNAWRFSAHCASSGLPHDPQHRNQMRGSISIERVVAFIYNTYHLEQPVGMFDTRYGRLRLAHDFGYGQLPDFFRPSIIGARLCFFGSDSVVDLVRKR